MGSFRIVTGSGYGRREITDINTLNNEFEKLKKLAAATNPRSPRIHVTKKTPPSGGKNGITSLYDKIWNDAVRKANKWARETAAEMRANVPVDTGNLYESIHVLEKECIRNKKGGEILMVVGVDLDPKGGRGKLFAPPLMKRSEKYGRKNAPWKGYRLMPSYPYDYSYKFLEEGNVLEERFKAISKKNAKKIMGK